MLEVVNISSLLVSGSDRGGRLLLTFINHSVTLHLLFSSQFHCNSKLNAGFEVQTHLVMNRLCCSWWIKYEEAVCHVGPSLQHNGYNYKFIWSSKNCSSTAFMFRVMKKCWTAAGFILCLDVCHTSLFQMFRQNQIKKRQPELTDKSDFKAWKHSKTKNDLTIKDHSLRTCTCEHNK